MMGQLSDSPGRKFLKLEKARIRGANDRFHCVPQAVLRTGILHASELLAKPWELPAERGPFGVHPIVTGQTPTKIDASAVLKFMPGEVNTLALRIVPSAACSVPQWHAHLE